MVSGELCSISHLSDIEESVRGSKLILGSHVVIDSFVKIKFSGGAGSIIIGDYVYINSGTVIYSGHGVSIGSNTLIAANVTIAATNHEYSEKGTPIRLQGFGRSKGGVSIGSDCWIGANSVLLDGSVVGDGSVIAAGSVVRGRVESFSVVGGNPLRIVSMRG